MMTPKRGEVTATPWGARRRTLRTVGAALVGLVLVAAGWLAVDVARARGALLAAAEATQGLRSRVLSGDAEGAAAGLATLQADARAAVESTRGPLWWLAARLPGAGPSFSAVQTVCEVVDQLATEALPALAEAASAADPARLTPRDGRIDLTPLEAAAGPLTRADAVLATDDARLTAIDRGALLPQVADPVGTLGSMVGDLHRTTANAARAVRLLPAMLGRSGKRRYLLLVQNNAELRSTGGLPAVLVLTADHGVLALEHSTDIMRELDTGKPVTGLTSEEYALYSARLAQMMVDVNLTPDFPRVGEIAAAHWSAGPWKSASLDGVLAVDPVVLQRILSVTGPVRTSSGKELNGSNTAAYLLNGVYRQYPDYPEQDAFFADAARSVLAQLTHLRSGAKGLLSALGASADEGRILVWSRHPEEQALILGSAVSGELRGDADGAPVIGLYFNDALSGKMTYYLDAQVDLTRRACLADGRRELTVRVTLSSSAPPDVASTDPSYVTGDATYVPRGTISVNLAVYAPTGGRLGDTIVDGRPSGVAAFTHDGLTVGMRTIDLTPGASHILEFDVITGQELAKIAQLRVTPLSRGARVNNADAPCATR